MFFAIPDCLKRLSLLVDRSNNSCLCSLALVVSCVLSLNHRSSISRVVMVYWSTIGMPACATLLQGTCWLMQWLIQEEDPLFLDQTEDRRVKKILFEMHHPLSQGLDDRPTPLSEGLDLPLGSFNILVVT